jgi:cell division protein FtsB
MHESLIKENKLLEHKIITCGVAATHEDAELTNRGAYADKWDSPQAQAVRELRAERDALKEEVSDWRDAAARAYKSPCKDEIHCSCVPLMRKQLDDVTAERDELAARVEELQEGLKEIAQWPTGRQSHVAKQLLSKSKHGAAESIRADERERCAKVAESEMVWANQHDDPTDKTHDIACRTIAAAIRAMEDGR